MKRRGRPFKSGVIEEGFPGSERFAQHVREFIYNPEGWTWDELEWVVMTAHPNSKAFGPVLERMALYRRSGCKINGTKEDTFTIEEKGQSKTLNSYGVQMEIKNRCLLAILDVMDKPMQDHGIRMRFVRGKGKDISHRFYEDGTSIFTRGHRDGKTVIVYGNRGSGKTTLATEYLLTDCLRAGMYGVGNVRLIDDLGKGPTNFGHASGAPLYTYSETMSGTLLTICENRLKGRCTVRLFDETQMGQMRTRAASDKYQTQKIIWHIERKLWAITIAVLQLESDIPTELRGFADLYVFKPYLEDKSLVDITTRGHTEYYKGVKHPKLRHKELKEMGIPTPKIDTDVWGVFIVDLNYADLLAHVAEEIRINLNKKSKEPVSMQQVRALKGYIEKHLAEEVIDDKDRAKVYLELRRLHDYSYKNLSEITGWSPAKLCRWEKKLYGNVET